MGELARVAGLWLHPVKSCRGIAVERARFGPHGLEHDREWALVDAGGEVLSQKRRPELARIGVALGDGALELASDGRAPLRVSTAPDSRAARRRVLLFGRELEAADCGDEAAAWLAELLGPDTRLVRVVRPREAFVDLMPLSILSRAALDGLSERAGRALEPGRFRPNVLVDGCPAHAEDRWRSVRAGDVVLDHVQCISRCVMVQLDPLTGEPEGDPLRALAVHRRVGGKVFFGSYFKARRAGVLAVGAALTT